MRTLLSLIILIPLVGGCDYTRPGRIQALNENTREQTTLLREQTTLLRQYRECLQRAETDENVDYSGYRTAIEVIDTRGLK